VHNRALIAQAKSKKSLGPREPGPLGTLGRFPKKLIVSVAKNGVPRPLYSSDLPLQAVGHTDIVRVLSRDPAAPRFLESHVQRCDNTWSGVQNSDAFVTELAYSP
jgi:hypothetical protein